MKKIIPLLLLLSLILKGNLYAGPSLSYGNYIRLPNHTSPLSPDTKFKVIPKKNDVSKAVSSAGSKFGSKDESARKAGLAFGGTGTIVYNSSNNYPLNTPITPLTPSGSAVVSPITNYTSTSAAVVASGTHLSAPWGIGTDASGNIYVCNYVTSPGTFDGVTEFSTMGVVSGFIANVQNITGIAFDGSGNAYTCTYKGKIFKFNSSGGGQTTFVTGPTNAAFTGITIDAAGNFYVADFVNKAVYKYNSSGAAATGFTTIVASSNLTDPTGVQVDAAGNIYVGDGGSGSSVNSSIVKYSANGTYISTLVAPGTGQGTYAYGFYMDNSNNIYVGDSGNNQLRMYTQTGNLLSTFTNSGNMGSPRGVFADASGNVYYTNNSTSVFYKFSVGGGYFLSSGGALPAGLIFNSSTGTISGTPVVTASGTYTVTGYTSTGAVTSNSFTINCNSTATNITYNPASDYLPAGTAITPITPTVTGTAPSAYSINPSLGNGLSFNTSTGAITGTPTGTLAATTYTVTATATGSPTAPITITVGAPPTISYSTPNNYPLGTAIATLAPTSSGVATISGTTGYSAPASLAVPPTNPWGIGSDPSGNIYVVNYSGNNVSKYTPAGAYSGTFIASVTGPTSIIFDAAGNAYVGTKTGSLFKYNNSGMLTSTFTTTAMSIYSLAIDASGNIYAADYVNKAVYKYTNGVQSTITFSTAPTDPAGVQVDAAGNIYICDITSGSKSQVEKYSSTGTLISVIIPNTALGSPCYGFYMDKSNNIYIGDSGNNHVYVFSQTGTLDYTFSGGLTSPRGVFADKLGNVYVSVYTPNLLYRYSPLGDFFISSGGQLPGGLTFNSTNGNITGTPTVAQTGTYTVTGYTSAGIPGTSNSFVINCYVPYDWVGTTSGDWNTTTNWQQGVVPGAANTATIGVNFAITNQPTIGLSGASTINVGAVIIGNKGGKAVNLTVNPTYTLSVAGDVTKQSDASSSTSNVSTLTGGGTITATNINVLATTATAPATFTESLTSSDNLTLSGNIALTSTNGSYASNAAFIIAAGTTSLTGTGTMGVIMTNNKSGSTSTLSMTGGILQFVNATPLSGLSATGNNTVSLTGGVIDYHGAAQTVYTDAAITGLTTGLTYWGLKFSGTGIKTLNGTTTNNLNIAGDFTNALPNDAADYVSLNSTIVNFNGTGAQNLAGGTASTQYGSIFTTVNFINAGVKTMTGGAFYVTSSGTLNMSNNAQLTAGDNTGYSGGVTTLPTTADSFLTLNSDATGSATVTKIPTGCSIVGNVNVQRFITGGAGYRGYRLVSSPVSVVGNITYTTFNYLINSSFIKGSTGTAGGFDATGNPNLYLYEDGLAPSNVTFTSGNFRGVNKINNGYTYSFDGEAFNHNLYQGDGYLFFFRGDRNAPGQTIATESVTTYVPTNTIATATGVLNQQSITPNYWYTGASTLDYTAVTGNSTVAGFNLIGNPYASTIDITTTGTSAANGITVTALGTSTGVNPYFYELNPSTQNYDTYNVQNGMMTNSATKYIVSGQGFFVLANSTGNTLTFNENAKVTAQNVAPALFLAKRIVIPDNSLALKQQEDQHLRLTLAKDSVNTDDIYIGFNSTASAKYVVNEDAPYHFGQGQVNLNSTSSDNISLAINITSLPTKKQAIPLGVYAVTDGLYTLNMKEMKNVPDVYDIWLKDAYMKDSLDTRHNATYTFNILHADTNSFGKNRFSLIIRQDPALALHLLNFTATKSTSSVQTSWIVENEANYTTFNLLKSTDGVSFSAIDSLVSSGTGTYSFTDVNPKNQNYYKLQLTDLAGNISYSSVISVTYSNTSKAINGLTVYPNPTNSTINIAVNQATIATSGLQTEALSANAVAVSSTGQTYDIKITNMTGEVLKTVTAVAGNWQNNVSGLLPGTYIIQVMNHGSSSVVGRTTFVKL